MKVKTNQMFESKAGMSTIKVKKVERDIYGDNRYDRVTVVNLSNGKQLKSTERQVYADSIRRRYYPV